MASKETQVVKCEVNEMRSSNINRSMDRVHGFTIGNTTKRHTMNSNKNDFEFLCAGDLGDKNRDGTTKKK